MATCFVIDVVVESSAQFPPFSQLSHIYYRIYVYQKCWHHILSDRFIQYFSLQLFLRVLDFPYLTQRIKEVQQYVFWAMMEGKGTMCNSFLLLYTFARLHFWRQILYSIYVLTLVSIYSSEYI